MYKTKKRKDSFFGIHCDFHAAPYKCDTVGAALREEDIREICTLLRPDFIQIDCKGHPGWASYPSSIGNAMPNFAGDPLALWRRVTREEGVALYMHYSGIYDIKYTAEHPEDCTVLANGTAESGTTRLGSKYADELLIPQICELAEKYEIDGLWIDGECWRASTDFSPESLVDFERDTGIDLGGRLPATPEDEYFHEYREYFRARFRKYLDHYVRTLHERYPNLQITSNWAFSDHMPEAVSVPLDYLSGDFNPTNSCNSARYAGRALAQQGCPWDLMSWNFRIKAGANATCVSKHKTQIMQEAAEVISLGGAYQNYVMQNNDGSPQMHELRQLAALSEFVRERKDFCFRGRIVHEAALLLSSYDRSHESKRLYSRNGYEKIMGACSLMADVGLSFEIASEHTLRGACSDYRMIVVPELFLGLEESTVSELLDYAKNGGALVLAGNKTCRLFAESGAPIVARDLPKYYGEGEKAYDNGGDTGHGRNGDLTIRSYVFTEDGVSFGALYSPTAVSGEDQTVHAYVAADVVSERKPLCVTVPYGSGSVTAIGFDIGSQYLSATQYTHRSLIKSVASSLYTPIIKVESALGLLETVCLSKDGRLMLQLINANGNHASATTVTEDFIPPVVDIVLSIKLESKPQALILQPEGRSLDFEYENGRARLRLDRLDIHSVIEVVK